ncbi:MAG: helix-turn-helix domain-containing protein [Acidiferrobacterales bacterium]
MRNEWNGVAEDGLLDRSQFTRDLGHRIRVRRAELGWSQEVLGALSGLHRSYICAVERGRVHISVVQLARIAQAFTVPPSALLESLQREHPV